MQHYRQPRLEPDTLMTINDGLLPDYVRIERKAVKHLRLVVNRDATVRLVLPTRASLKSGLAFYNDRQAWVSSKREQLKQNHQSAADVSILGRLQLHGADYSVLFNAAKDAVNHLTREVSIRGPESESAQYRVWRNIAAEDLRQRLVDEAERLQVTVNKVSIRDQKSRWGSCSMRGNISLNWRVALMPVSVGNYIIAHEFSHLAHMNHSAAFWQEVERLCPAYKEAELWIKQQGSALMLVGRI